jgi:hypothetical protein
MLAAIEEIADLPLSLFFKRLSNHIEDFLIFLA